MAKLIYSAITSLDGCIADKDGNFDWAAPDEEVHTFVNELERAADKIVFSTKCWSRYPAPGTQTSVSFEPLRAVRHLKATAGRDTIARRRRQTVPSRKMSA